MFSHKKIVEQYIEKYGEELPQHDKELLYHILLNPESKLSGDLFELHNNQAALELVDAVLAQKEFSVFENKIRELCKLPYDREVKSILHMQYGTQKCRFATIDDIYHILKNFPHINTDITENKPTNYYDNLILHDGILLSRLFESKDESSQKLMKERDEYMIYRMIFFELIKPIRRTIGVEPFIALVKKGIIEDEIDEHYIQLHDSFNSMNWLMEDNTFDIEDIRHMINKIEVYEKRNRKHKLEQMEVNLGAKRMSAMLDIIYLKKQLKTQNAIVKKYFNNSNIDNVIVDFFERNYTESRNKIKKLGFILQNKEVFLWAYFNGHLTLK